MKKFITLSLLSAVISLSLCGCSKGDVYPKNLTTDPGYLWVAVNSGTQTAVELSINDSNYCILNIVRTDGEAEITYKFNIMYDNTSGNASVLESETAGGISGNIIAAQGSEKSTISAKFTQVVSGGEKLIFQGLLTYTAVLQ